MTSGCSIQKNPSSQALELNGCGTRLCVGINVEDVGESQSTWNSYTWSRSAGKPRCESCTCTMYSGVPLRGNLLPSRSAASIWLWVTCGGVLMGAGTKKVTNCGAGLPASIADRSNAEIVLPSPLKILLGSAVA